MSLRTSALGLGAAIAANAALVVAAIVASAAGTPSHSDLQFVTRGKSNRIVIFVDGLSSDPAKTFRWGQGVPSWPELMAADTTAEHQQLPLARYDTALLSFAGAAQDKQSIPQLATSALAEIKNKGILENYDGITFVAYSAGGLVLKSMLIQGSIAGAKSLSTKTKVVFLLSVPAQGKAAAGFLTALIAKQPLVANIGAMDVPVFLQGLESLWAEHLSSRGPTRPLKIYCLHETEATYGTPVQAGQYSADGCDDSGELAGTDHSTIAKPGSRDAAAYKWVKTHLADYFQRFPADAGKAKAGPQIAVADIPTASTSKGSTSLSTGSVSVAPLPSAAAPPTPAAKAQPKPALPPAPAIIAAPPSPKVEPKTVVADNQPPKPNPPPAASTAFSPVAPSSTEPEPRVPSADAQVSQARRRAKERPPVTYAETSPAKSGNWTLHVTGSDCNLAAQLWVVKVADHRVRSDNWDAKIGRDGKFEVHKANSCSTELVRGDIAGKLGSGWYMYSDPCAQIYCRAKFKMTWRRPQPEDIAQQ